MLNKVETRWLQSLVRMKQKWGHREGVCYAAFPGLEGVWGSHSNKGSTQSFKFVVNETREPTLSCSGQQGGCPNSELLLVISSVEEKSKIPPVTSPILCSLLSLLHVFWLEIFSSSVISVHICSFILKPHWASCHGSQACLSRCCSWDISGLPWYMLTHVLELFPKADDHYGL